VSVRRRVIVSLSLSLSIGAAVMGRAEAHPPVETSPNVAPPSELSTSGDYATDVLGDPWDFSNDDDVPPAPLIGSENGFGISRSPDGRLNVRTVANTTVKLVRTWGTQLPWGRDGQLRPVDADRYTRLSFSMCVGERINMGVHFFTDSGGQGIIPLYPPGGCSQQTVDLKDRSLYAFPAFSAEWTGRITRLELLSGGAFSGSRNIVDLSLDWVRLHRADAPPAPPAGVPIPRVLTPNEEGGADHATDSGNPWDFCGPDDVVNTGHITNVVWSGCDMYGTTFANDSFVELPMRTPLNPDRYHRATVEACYDGPMSFADAPGGGMNARFAWLRAGAPRWTETQDVVIYPGCNRMTFDLATTPPVAVNDENSILKEGWRGQRFSHLRFDLNEDPGPRNFTLREIRLADDAAFSSTYPITFLDAAGTAGTKVEVWVTTERGAFNGTRVAAGVPVHGGVNTFTWNGTDGSGAPMPNGTYWVWLKMSNGSGVGSAYSTGPVRLERPVPDVPSYFVPLNPARLLDTRSGQGGNIVPLGDGVLTELDVTGVGGVPETGVTAVVMNVAVADPTSSGFVTAWPSGRPRPLVASLNFVPGQIVPNLVSVKVGANGRVNLFNSSGSTNVIADVMGYYTDVPPSSGGRFTALTPARILDTRDGTGRAGVAAPVGGGQWIDVPVTGVGGVPATGVSGVALNVTVDQPSGSGFLTAWPTGEPRPFTATHNFVPGLTVGNLTLAKVGAGGRVSIFNSSGATHVVADVVGYFSSSGGAFVPIEPRRLVDSRDGTGGRSGAMAPGESLSVGLTGGSIPPGAKAVIVNVTSADSTEPSYITAWPTGAPRPLAATMNPRPGVPVPNQAYLKLGEGGQLSLYNYAGSTHVIIDAFGYVM